jgi:hypothetical protein
LSSEKSENTKPYLGRVAEGESAHRSKRIFIIRDPPRSFADELMEVLEERNAARAMEEHRLNATPRPPDQCVTNEPPLDHHAVAPDSQQNQNEPDHEIRPDQTN